MKSAHSDLWTDWCAVTGTSPKRRDYEALELFARQATPSRRVLAALRVDAEQDPGSPATAWPAGRHGDDGALGRLLRLGSARIGDPATSWIDRLRLRRLMFAGVLLAPVRQGGLGFTRDRALDLDPRGLRELRPRIGRAEEEVACPACAVWSWLHVLGTNSGWQHAMVRALAHRRDEPRETHRHERLDPSPDWSDWKDCANLLPSIDRWGYVDRYASIHRSSLSVLAHAMAWMLDSEMVTNTASATLAATGPAAPAQRVTPEEEVAILARADELNARIVRILAELD